MDKYCQYFDSLLPSHTTQDQHPQGNICVDKRLFNNQFHQHGIFAIAAPSFESEWASSAVISVSETSMGIFL